MKTKIYLVRHAEVNNPNHIYYVWLPHFGLSKIGEFQAQKLKMFFAKKNISQIFASPLLRTKKTAEIISNNKIPVKYTRKLIEAYYVKWQGLTITQKSYKILRMYLRNPKQALYVGETVEHVQRRMVAEIIKLAKRFKGKEIIIVSHADPIIAAKLFFEGKPLNTINKVVLKNASITSLTFNEELKCEKVEYKEIVPAKKDVV